MISFPGDLSFTHMGLFRDVIETIPEQTEVKALNGVLKVLLVELENHFASNFSATSTTILSFSRTFILQTEPLNYYIYINNC